jgi:hypothetical protein
MVAHALDDLLRCLLDDLDGDGVGGLDAITPPGCAARRRSSGPGRLQRAMSMPAAGSYSRAMPDR